jgi:hypothetical protein
MARGVRLGERKHQSGGGTGAVLVDGDLHGHFVRGPGPEHHRHFFLAESPDDLPSPVKATTQRRWPGWR